MVIIILLENGIKTEIEGCYSVSSQVRNSFDSSFIGYQEVGLAVRVYTLHRGRCVLRRKEIAYKACYAHQKDVLKDWLLD
jgi:hypothetical protein